VKSLLTKSLSRIPLGSAHAGDIDTRFATRIALDCINNKVALHYKGDNGYLNCSIDSLISKLNISDKHLVWVCDDTRMYYNNVSILTVSSKGNSGDSVNIKYLSSDEKLLSRYDKFVEKHIEQRIENTINVLTSGPNGIALTSLVAPDAPLVEDNYSPEVLEKYKKSIADLKESNPRGRLHIINGPPGTGKTYLIRAMIKELTESDVLILPANLVREIDGPGLLTTFINHRRYSNGKTPMTLIIEDADACLVARMSDNISAISTLLNCADGILGSILDMRIIATTNQEVEFDKALVRNGRLSQHINVVELHADRANKVYENLTGSARKILYDGPTLLADIYADAYDADNGHKNAENTLLKNKRTIGFGARLIDHKELIETVPSGVDPTQQPASQPIGFKEF